MNAYCALLSRRIEEMRERANGRETKARDAHDILIFVAGMSLALELARPFLVKEG